MKEVTHAVPAFLYRLYRKAPLSLRLRIRSLLPGALLPRNAAPPDPGAVAVLSKVAAADDGRIVDRLAAAYRRSAAAAGYYAPDSMWSGIRERQQEIHELLLRGPREELAHALRDPGEYNLLYGFENLFSDFLEVIAKDPTHPRRMGGELKGHLVRLGEASGLFRIDLSPHPPEPGKLRLTAAELVAGVGRRLGFPLEIPAVFAGLDGLPVEGGVLTYRMIQAAYCAHRVKSMTAGPVLEIGAGAGYLAYYLHRLGLDVTIIDLPMTNVTQGYFLMRALGEDAVVLEGEPARPGAIKVQTPAHLDSAPRYDLVANVDSLTEVGREAAENYLRWVVKNARLFWSVNHEANPFTVNELLKGFPDVSVARFPYWIREGFVEEIVTC